MPLQDVKVTIDIRQPSSLTGLGTPVILVEDATATNPTYTEYFDTLVAQDALGPNTIGAKYVSKVFGQANRPSKVAIIKYKENPAQALERFYFNDFYFVLMAEGELAEHIAVADFVEAQGIKMAAFATDEMSDVTAFSNKKYDRTIVFYHNDLNELPEAALIGSIGSLPVGSVTWKFKTLAGVSPIEINAGELIELHNKGAIAYVRKSGINQTSEGIVASGEYIDVIHSKDWVRLNIETEVQTLLSNSKKIPYTDAGIAQLEAVVTNVLQTGVSNGVIATDVDGIALYTITALSRAATSASERKARVYNGLGFTFELAGAIHETNIKGEVLI